jgi:hypothetical protein
MRDRQNRYCDALFDSGDCPLMAMRETSLDSLYPQLTALVT